MIQRKLQWAEIVLQVSWTIEVSYELRQRVLMASQSCK
jgi:hypothetical protein